MWDLRTFVSVLDIGLLLSRPSELQSGSAKGDTQLDKQEEPRLLLSMEPSDLEVTSAVHAQRVVRGFLGRLAGTCVWNRA